MRRYCHCQRHGYHYTRAALSGSGYFCEGVPVTINMTVIINGIGPWEVVFNNNGNNETYTFTSSPGTITISEPGTYNLVSVESPGDCPGNVSGTVNIQEIILNLTTNATDPLCNGQTHVNISASASGATVPYT